MKKYTAIVLMVFMLALLVCAAACTPVEPQTDGDPTSVSNTTTSTTVPLVIDVKGNWEGNTYKNEYTNTIKSYKRND